MTAFEIRRLFGVVGVTLLANPGHAQERIPGSDPAPPSIHLTLDLDRASGDAPDVCRVVVEIVGPSVERLRDRGFAAALDGAGADGTLEGSGTPSEADRARGLRRCWDSGGVIERALVGSVSMRIRGAAPAGTTGSAGGDPRTGGGPRLLLTIPDCSVSVAIDDRMDASSEESSSVSGPAVDFGEADAVCTFQEMREPLVYRGGGRIEWGLGAGDPGVGEGRPSHR